MIQGQDIDPNRIAAGVEALLRGGLVAFPTETVYGLGADATQAEAVARIFEVKGRPRGHPLIVHVAGIDAAQAWARQIPLAAQMLMERFWPGPLTLILPRSALADDGITGGQDSIGLRMPSNPWALALIRGLSAAKNDPAAAIAAPSANRFGRISPTRAAHVRADLGEKPLGAVDVILDGGPSTVGIESTIVDCTGPVLRVLRPGFFRPDQIVAALEAIGIPVAAAGEGDDAPRVSGRLKGHYAPLRPLELVAAADLLARISALRFNRLAVLAPNAVLADVVAVFGSSPVRCFAASADPDTYAHSLYDHLRAMEASGADRLLVVLPPGGANWAAIQDRLRRAEAGSNATMGGADAMDGVVAREGRK